MKYCLKKRLKQFEKYIFSKDVNEGIYCSTGPLCVIYDLDAENFDDFESGKVDAFKGTEIQYCNNRFVSESLSMIKIKHTGSDTWGVDWIKVQYDDAFCTVCPEFSLKKTC